MRILALFTLALSASPLVAQIASTQPTLPAPQVTKPSAPVAAAPASDAQQLASFQAQLDAVRLENDRLKLALADTNALKASNEAITTKNLELVKIENEMVATYEKRFRYQAWAPFEGSRRKFEQNLQKISERIYQSRADYPVVAAIRPGALTK